jgi:hypothetical protein
MKCVRNPACCKALVLVFFSVSYLIVLENPGDGHVNLCSEFSEDMAAG